MKKFFFIILTVLSISFFSCNKDNSKKDGALTIVTTTFPVYDAVRVVGKDFIGSKINLKLLVKPGTEVHSYDPSPADIISIQNSDLFIFVGGESDEWVEKILKSSEKELKAQILSLMDYVKTIDEPEFEDEAFDDESEESDEEHHHEENEHERDEHIWTSPENEIIIINTISDTLCKIAEKKGISDFSDIIQNNKDSYIKQIYDLIDYTKAIISVKSEKFLLMADRFPLVYFTDYYGLNYDAAFSGCSTAVEANAQTISRLVDTVKEKNLPAIFYIELGNHKIADSISEITGAKTILLQSCQNVSKIDFENGETWLTLMKHNSDALNDGLR